MAKAAAQHAVVADFLIVCLGATAEIPFSLADWFESWLDQRGSRHGALIDLNPPPSAGISQTEWPDNLRAIAERGNFDYLTTVPEQPEATSSSANQAPDLPKLSAIEDPTRYSRPPSRFGLNE